jgi:hypothetical protein
MSTWFIVLVAASAATHLAVHLRCALWLWREYRSPRERPAAGTARTSAEHGWRATTVERSTSTRSTDLFATHAFGRPL